MKLSTAIQAEIETVRRELAAISRKIFARGLSWGGGGNTSARIPGSATNILIKASGKSLDEVEADDFLLIDLEGRVLEGRGTPSVETRFHCGIYTCRPEVQAIVHGHAPYVTAYASARREMPLAAAAAEAGLSEIGMVEEAEPGSPELARLVIDTFRQGTLKAAVLRRHGFVALGESLAKAYYMADALEYNAKVACLIGVLGPEF